MHIVGYFIAEKGVHGLNCGFSILLERNSKGTDCFLKISSVDRGVYFDGVHISDI